MNQIPKQGPPKTPLTQKEIDYIVKYNQKAHVGYITMAGIAKRDPFAPKSLTIWRCHLVYEIEDLYQFLHLYRSTDDEDHPNRYVAQYINQAWVLSNLMGKFEYLPLKKWKCLSIMRDFLNSIEKFPFKIFLWENIPFQI